MGVANLRPQEYTGLFGLKRTPSRRLRTIRSSAAGIDDILPYAEVEGQHTVALGQFLAFLEDISHLITFCEQPHLISIDKVNEALLVIDCFLPE